MNKVNIVGALIVSFLIGYYMHIPDISEEVRASLIQRCISNEAMQEEINDRLPTNGKGQITAAILRDVLHDVVTNCK